MSCSTKQAGLGDDCAQFQDSKCFETPTPGMQEFFNEMHPVYLQSDCSGAEGAFMALMELAPGKAKLLASCLDPTKKI